jgi:sterol desaturase/sphingolipid hydroxylase (fatty acid hydroxylase superfamily)
MQEYIDLIANSYTGYWNYLKNEILLQNGWDNYFYGLIIISLLTWGLEIIFPWRKNQSVFRKDFWLDTFYMFFNFFLLNLIFLIALSNTAANFFNSILQHVGISMESLQIINHDSWPLPVALFTFFVVSDFVQWNVHRLLHKTPFLWKYHKVHHSVKEMGFSAHLRYHWMEPIVYKSFLYLPLAIVGGFSSGDLAIVYFFTIAVGHLNHANLGWDYGILKYIFNSPKMHIWHHAKELPTEHATGANFGLTLSVWDYLFRTNYIPHSGRDIELGFDGDEDFPDSFLGQEGIL